jgi:2-polyprenyl-3-methyl-5-hydroxy-6-metoxy-1,4-benzoquinol methylase
MNSNEIDYGLHYREWHNDSDEHAKLMASVAIQEIEPHLPKEKSARILDIGCGMGFALLRLRELGYVNSTGVDIDKSQVDACHKRGLNVEKISNLVEYLEKHSDTFDLVLMIDVLEHIPVNSQISVLSAIHSSIRNNGQLIAQVPNANSIIASRWRNIDFTHTSTFTEYSLKFVLLSAKFGSVTIPPSGNKIYRPTLRLHRYFKARQRMVFRRWLVRWLWRQVMIAEMGTHEINSIPLNPNMFAIACK